MRQRAKPAKSRTKAGVVRKAPNGGVSQLRDLEKRLAEALEQQTATAEILGIISASPADAQPVFDAIAVNALRLCDAKGAVVVRYDGELLHVVAHHTVNPEAVDRLKRQYPQVPTRHPLGRAVLDGVVVQVPDLQATEEFSGSVARQFGARGHVSIPLLHRGRAIGAIGISRPTLGPFSDRQVALLKAFADQAVIAIENARLFNELAARNADLTETLARQTATTEILRVISEARTDVQPVLDTILRSAVRLCDGFFAALFTVKEDLLHLAATHDVPEEAFRILRESFPVTLDANLLVTRAARERRVVRVRDIQAEGSPARQPLSAAIGERALVAVPMMRGESVLGLITVSRREASDFSDKQVALLQTFADQAVIAIENVRLFTELQTSNGELTRALETQTATSDILRVISRSQTDVQPVFDAILASAVRLLGAYSGSLTRVAGDQIQLVALTSTDDAGDAAVRARYPQRLRSEDHQAQTLRDRVPLNVADALTDPRLSEATRAYAAARGWRSAALVPMLRHGEAVGTISVTRREPGGFTDDEIALLQTFADQAVIAIENARLFKELEEKNRALTEAHARVTETLEQQTATSEVLRVISSSLTDVNPVFRTILANANRLCDASFSVLWLWDGEAPTAVAHENVSPAMAGALRTARPLPDRRSPLGLSILEQTIVHVADVLTDFRFTPEDVPSYRLESARSILCVPMVREGSLVGLINIWRREPRAFTDGQIALLQTFADQAVIAIENVRLFKELEARTTDLTRSVDQLTALGEVGRAVSSTLDLGTVLTTIVSRAVQLSGLDGGVVFEYDESAEEFIHRAQTGTGGSAAAARRGTRFLRGDGLIGRTAITLEPIQVSDITVPGAYVGPNRESLIESGIRAILAVPMVRENRLIGCLGVSRNRPGEFPAETIELLRTFATQSALAIQNARLFHEIEVKSRQLELASRHKSEFLANMSHELRTPLNAVIGFSEVLSDRMFGELNDKQDEYLKDIHASGQHLLSLINDILDLSKIEAGRMELDLTDFDGPTAIENALTLVRERAGRRGIALHQAVDQQLGRIRGDERKIKQVLLNLLSNALKFTPEGGRVEVRASVVDGMAEISVADNGVGIAPADQEAIFEEFRQVGTADKKVEGTGLGLALSRKFVELHGGRIWVESRVGAGSTFTFAIPVRGNRESG